MCTWADAEHHAKSCNALPKGAVVVPINALKIHNNRRVCLAHPVYNPENLDVLHKGGDFVDVSTLADESRTYGFDYVVCWYC